MISYNYTTLNELFTSLSSIVGANISIYDNNFDCSHVENCNDSFFCSIFRDDIKHECSLSDAAALKRSSNEKKPFFYKCHFGYVEIMIPYNLNQNTNFYVCVGPFRDETTTTEMIEKITALSKKAKKDVGNALNAFLKTPLFTEEKFNSIVNIINSIVDYAKYKKLIAVKDGFIESQLDPFLEKNLSKNILTSDIAAEFYYSNKQLETAIKQYTGISPKKYILKYKMNAAKDLLVNTDKNLQTIANDVGFSDYNYFIKVFKSFTNDTPLHYRKKFESKSFNN